jgi:heme-degrading monooxygenase HmoA
MGLPGEGMMDAALHVSIRTYAGLGSQTDRLVPLIQDDLVPRLKQAAGFKGYCAFASDDGHLVSVAIFADHHTAERAEAQFANWQTADLHELMARPPEITSGESLLHEVADVQRNGGPAMFVSLRIFEGLGPREDVLSLLRQHVFLHITGAAGFRGYYAFRDERQPGRGVSVSLFDTREHGTQANEHVVSVMRDRQIAPSSPSVMIGPTLVVSAG